MDEKATLHKYLRAQRENLLAKLDELGEYDARRPLTPTGTNLLGLVKHVGSVQLAYFGLVFGRPADRQPAWMADDAPMDADMWATADEPRADIVDFYRYSGEHSDATIELLPLDATGMVPWWPEERRDVTLHQILVHLCVETARHAGHADILRELLDGAARNGPADPNIPDRAAAEWAEYRAGLEAAAVEAAGAEASRAG
jgi:uncharacterized damage-inducible protein DinB